MGFLPSCRYRGQDGLPHLQRTNLACLQASATTP
jgi:hypothetical protein